jgi:hypothetical protein
MSRASAPGKRGVTAAAGRAHLDHLALALAHLCTTTPECSSSTSRLLDRLQDLADRPAVQHLG